MQFCSRHSLTSSLTHHSFPFHSFTHSLMCHHTHPLTHSLTHSRLLLAYLCTLHTLPHCFTVTPTHPTTPNTPHTLPHSHTLSLSLPHTHTHTHTVTVTSLTDCAHSLTHSLTHCDYLHLDNNLFVCCCYRDTTHHTTHEVGWCTNTTRLHVLRLVGRMVGRTGGRQMTTRRNNMALQNSVVWLSYEYLVGKQGLALWHRAAGLEL